jgi:PAS domain-containing protein
MNKKAGEILERNPEEMIGKRLDGVSWICRSSSFKACYKAVEDQQYIYLEKKYIPYEVWFENHIYPSVDGLSIFRDISEKKKSDAIIEKKEK